MSAQALETAACKLSIWLAARLAAPRLCPVPLSDVRGRIEALLHSRQATAMICALGLVVVVHSVRSAWRDVYGRWYRHDDGSSNAVSDFLTVLVTGGARSLLTTPRRSDRPASSGLDR